MDADLLQPDLITVNAAIAACGLMGRWTRGPHMAPRTSKAIQTKCPYQAVQRNSHLQFMISRKL